MAGGGTRETETQVRRPWAQPTLLRCCRPAAVPHLGAQAAGCAVPCRRGAGALVVTTAVAAQTTMPDPSDELNRLRALAVRRWPRRHSARLRTATIGISHIIERRTRRDCGAALV
jgi:hypothetical protein